MRGFTLWSHITIRIPADGTAFQLFQIFMTSLKLLINGGGYYPYPAGLPNPGHRQNVGFLIGQQYNLTTDAPLNARNRPQLLLLLQGR